MTRTLLPDISVLIGVVGVLAGVFGGVLRRQNAANWRDLAEARGAQIDDLSRELGELKREHQTQGKELASVRGELSVIRGLPQQRHDEAIHMMTTQHDQILEAVKAQTKMLGRLIERLEGNDARS